MKNEQKETIHRLISELQKSTAFEADSIKTLVKLLYEEVKDGLVTAFGDELIKLQGEARAMDRLYKRLTSPIVTAKPEE